MIFPLYTIQLMSRPSLILVKIIFTATKTIFTADKDNYYTSENMNPSIITKGECMAALIKASPDR